MGPITQWLEYFPYKEEVLGSNPSWSTDNLGNSMNLKDKLTKIIKKIDNIRTIQGWKISIKPIFPLEKDESFLTRNDTNDIIVNDFVDKFSKTKKNS